MQQNFFLILLITTCIIVQIQAGIQDKQACSNIIMLKDRFMYQTKALQETKSSEVNQQIEQIEKGRVLIQEALDFIAPLRKQIPIFAQKKLYNVTMNENNIKMQILSQVATNFKCNSFEAFEGKKYKQICQTLTNHILFDDHTDYCKLSETQEKVLCIRDLTYSDKQLACQSVYIIELFDNLIFYFKQIKNGKRLEQIQYSLKKTLLASKYQQCGEVCKNGAFSTLYTTRLVNGYKIKYIDCTNAKRLQYLIKKKTSYRKSRIVKYIRIVKRKGQFCQPIPFLKIFNTKGKQIHFNRKKIFLQKSFIQKLKKKNRISRKKFKKLQSRIITKNGKKYIKIKGRLYEVTVTKEKIRVKVGKKYVTRTITRMQMKGQKYKFHKSYRMQQKRVFKFKRVKMGKMVRTRSKIRYFKKNGKNYLVSFGITYQISYRTIKYRVLRNKRYIYEQLRRMYLLSKGKRYIVRRGQIYQVFMQYKFVNKKKVSIQYIMINGKRFILKGSYGYKGLSRNKQESQKRGPMNRPLLGMRRSKHIKRQLRRRKIIGFRRTSYRRPVLRPRRKNKCDTHAYWQQSIRPSLISRINLQYGIVGSNTLKGNIIQLYNAKMEIVIQAKLQGNQNETLSFVKQN